MQQQNYSLDALAKRDAKDDPFKTAAPPAPEPAAEEDDEPVDEEEAEGLDEDKLKLLALLMDPYVTPTTKTRMPQ
jgi:hypothetical protein